MNEHLPSPPPYPLTGPNLARPGPARSRLLIVDDQAINLQILYQIFRDEHDVFFATSGAQALDFCNRQALPDLILLDIIMEGMDGLEVCRRLKEDPLTAGIPVIFVTAQSSADEETAALDAGGVDFISKPVTPAVVKARVRTHLLLKAQADQLRQQAFIDGLTGIANRRRFDEALITAWRDCLRRQLPLALLLIDIDHFKPYNDHYGHQAGDDCLRAVAGSIATRLLRAHDLAARYGGEEFVCLLPDCDLDSAGQKASDIHSAIAHLGLPHAASPISPRVTVSIGASASLPDAALAPQQLLSASDEALYAAKAAGRNRTICRELTAG